MAVSRLKDTLLMLSFLAIISLYPLGCASPRPTAAPEPSVGLKIRRVLVVPFKKATERYEIGSSIRCSVCGGVFITGHIESGADKYMTEQLMAFLESKTEYTLIPPGAAAGVRSEMLSEDLRVPERRLLVEMGRRLQADGVLSGVIYRFRQRIGTSLSVDKPASVAFGIHFIRVADNRFVWGGHFDETQHSLSENLFKLGTFVKRGGGWLTAEQLATFGLHETMGTLPLP